MAAFTPNFKIVQSSDGKTLTITDLSNWTSNDEGYVKADFARTFTLKDAYGATLTTIGMGTTADVATYNVTKNLWIETTFTIVGLENYSLLQKQLFDRFNANAYRNSLSDDAYCCSKTGVSNLVMADLFITGVNFAVPIGNGVDVQKFEDVAYSYLT